MLQIYVTTKLDLCTPHGEVNKMSYRNQTCSTACKNSISTEFCDIMKDVIWIIFNPLADQVDDEGEKEESLGKYLIILT